MTIPKECKRLAEVDFPIAEVSRHAAREKSIRHGHPSTLHLWWARRPLASCRAMLLALLLPDPCDPACPDDFKAQARALLKGLPNMARVDADDAGLRRALLAFIGDFANWDNAARPAYLAAGRGLVRAAHGAEPPLVVDPFAGGGSIPLEALRLGCDAFASDLNPVAVLINKVMLEDIPRHGPGLADELRRVGAEIKAAAEKELAEFYPPDPGGSRPIAYLWARTVRCESPNCGAEIPLVRSFWLAKKANRRRALRYTVVRPPRSAPHLEFEVFTPKRDGEVPEGTVSRARATCPCCNTVLPPKRVRAQLTEQRGGADVEFDAQGHRIGGAYLLAVVMHSATGRDYRLATEGDYIAVNKAMQCLLDSKAKVMRHGLPARPEEPLPPIGTLGFRVQRYGMLQWGDVFTARQNLVLSYLNELACGMDVKVTASPPLQRLITVAVSRYADDYSSLCRWMDRETPAPTFTRHALPMIWDFCEIWPWDEASWSFGSSVEWVSRAAETTNVGKLGQVQQADACDSSLPTESAGVWFTDPPYYDAIPYSDISDFFYVQLKRSLNSDPLFAHTPDALGGLTPKLEEIVQDETRQFNGLPKDRRFFEQRMGVAFHEGYRVLAGAGNGCVVFAHKTTEGWEALLTGMVSGGWTITGSWPIATERPGRVRSHDSAALATSIHLVCRPRAADAPVGDWSQVYRQLPARVTSWMERLEAEGVRGADLVFACIGPALELYSRYSKVVDAEDREIPLGGDPAASEPHRRGYLAYVWETVARSALEQVLGAAEANARNGAAGALEEDARLTALFLWTLQSTDGEEAPRGDDAAGEDEEGGDEEEGGGATSKKPKGYSLVYDVARRFAQPLGIHLDAWEGRIIATEKGVVRLLPVAERARALFGEDGADAVAGEIERSPLRARDIQQSLFPDANLDAPAVRGRGGRRAAHVPDAALGGPRGATTLDRVHAAMLLQKGGRTNALRALLQAEQERGPAFLRLANALSGLYPTASEEKRLVDAMLLAYPKAR